MCHMGYAASGNTSEQVIRVLKTRGVAAPYTRIACMGVFLCFRRRFIKVITLCYTPARVIDTYVIILWLMRKYTSKASDPQHDIMNTNSSASAEHSNCSKVDLRLVTHKAGLSCNLDLQLTSERRRIR